MNAVRFNTTPALAASATERERKVHGPESVRPVSGADAADADRRRSLQEELQAAEEHRPQAIPDALGVETKEVLEELSRLGPEAVNVLQPLSAAAMKLVQPERIDEEA